MNTRKMPSQSHAPPTTSLYPQIEPISIDALTDHIAQALTNTPELRHVWVSGEVSSASFHPSGIYFTLKDLQGRSSLPAVVWKSQVPELEEKPQVGTQVLAFGKISVYAPHGKYQFQVQQILPLGEGLQALRLQRLKQQLSAEGLFDLERKQPLPVHPRTIAVVTAPTAAAWGDIQRVLLSRYPGVKVLLSPATVQGNAAPQSIAQAIDRVLADGRAEVLILARGGGATEDLSCFDSEVVARAVADCALPVVTGIGHERDESLADLAADVRSATPTAAASIVVPALGDLVEEHLARVDRLRVAVQRKVDVQRCELVALRSRFERVRPDKLVAVEIDRLAGLRRRLRFAVVGRLEIARQEQLRLQERSQALDPSLVLKRGYAVVRRENQEVVRDGDGLVVGEELSVQFGTGKTIKVRVIDDCEG
jgi:exodeoxyribonuclease VII large subunit